MINRSAAMALFLPLFLVLLLATGGQANANELSTSQGAVPEPAPAPNSYKTSSGPLEATGGRHQREINIGPCFPSKGGNVLSDDTGNAPSCIKRCTSKGYASGRCDTVSGGFPGDCFCLTLELSTSQGAVPEPAPAPKGYKTSRGPLEATGGQPQREINIGPCFPSRGNNALSDDRGNALSCPKRCTSKGYAGGLCNTVSGGFPGDCFCLTG